MEVIQTLDIGVIPGSLRVSHKDYPIHSPENQLPAGIVVDLARDCVKMKTGFEALDLPKLKREKIEEECPVHFGGEGYQFALGLG
jgi:hypothetical protein